MFIYNFTAFKNICTYILCFDIYHQGRKGGKLICHSTGGKTEEMVTCPKYTARTFKEDIKNQFPPTWQILGLILIANKEWCQEMLEFFEFKSISLSTTLFSLPNVKQLVQSHSAGWSQVAGLEPNAELTQLSYSMKTKTS